MYCFVGDNFYPAEEPLGRNGPKLEEFLSMDEEVRKNSAFWIFMKFMINFVLIYMLLCIVRHFV